MEVVDGEEHFSYEGVALDKSMNSEFPKKRKTSSNGKSITSHNLESELSPRSTTSSRNPSKEFF